ncbi:MAG: hypothetical protein NW224_12215 [Leptolyngbyaceae cyanobacterium bins.302]|nr:hypothetical protein [Leptolyngbyaceae cyanobacterium bins.302]
MMLTVDLQSNSVELTDSSELGVMATQNTVALEESSQRPETPQEAPQPTSAAIAQSVIRLAEGVQPVTLAAGMTATPETVLEAMRRLVDVIVELRSPDGGWSTEIPQTPETLLPYVTEEAYDLLDALQQQSIQPLLHPTIPSPTGAQFLHQDNCSIADLTPWLLWAIARSSYEVMQLLEGMEVQVADPEQEWQSGVLRLAIALQLDSPNVNWTFDLVTHQPGQPQLPTTAQIQNTTLNPNSPLLAGEFVQQIVQQIQRSTPTLCPFVVGIQTTVLIPQHDWQTGRLRLQFGLEFVPTTLPQQEHSLEASPVTTDTPEAERATLSPQPSSLKPLIQFTDAPWSSRYSAIVNQQHLDAILTHLQMSNTKTAIHLSSTTSVTEVVTAGLIIADQLQQSSTLASRNIPHQTWRLDTLNLRLLWCVSRGGHDIMQLMAGIAVQVLQPTQLWQSGTLRLAINLKLQTPELDWQLDLVTGRPVSLNAYGLMTDAVVQSLRDTPEGARQTEWCQYPILVQQLTHKVMQDIQHATPEIQLLLDGTEINLQHANEPWQPGTLQLILGFEFVPDRVIK